MVVDLEPAADALRRASPLRPRIMVVLGSGLGALADRLSGAKAIPLGRIPGMAPASVEGHEGSLRVGRLDGTPVWVQSGRLHLYEGRSAAEVTAPARTLAELGVDVAILTNASGGIREDLEAGSLVVLDDVLNLTFRNPATAGFTVPTRRVVGGRMNASGSIRIVRSGTEAFDPGLRELAETAALSRGVRLFRGIYAGVLGPSFETPAEIRMIRRLGGDVVGMSTVPEVLALRRRKVRLLGLSLVTNRAAGLRQGRLSHREVVETARSRASVLTGLIRGVVRRLGEWPEATRGG